MKTWRLTQQAECSLQEIALWTLENFGEFKAIEYRDNLISCINRLANGESPHAKTCSQLIENVYTTEELYYYREGRHFIIFRENKDCLDILEFIHERCNLPYHLKNITKKK